MYDIQFDYIDLLAKENFKNIQKIVKNNPDLYSKLISEHSEESSAFEDILLNKLDQNWDGDMSPNSVEGAIYLEFLNHFYSSILQKQVPDEVERRVLFEGFYIPTFMFNFFEGVALNPNF